MLPLKNRLTRKDDFQLVHKDGKFFSVRDLSLLRLANGLDRTRIGIVVSKKSFPKAVDRNRTRRLIRETLRRKMHLLRPGFDVVIHSKLREKASLKEIEASLVGLLKKSGLLN